MQPELVESLIPVDISPINSKEVNDIQSILDILRSFNLDVNAPISKVRKLADEHMKSSIEVCSIPINFHVYCYNNFPLPVLNDNEYSSCTY